jgi:hypothetical protein
LSKAGVVTLHPGCGRCVAASHRAVDHLKVTILPLIQPQLEVGIPAPGEVLRTPLDVKDAVRSSATYRREDAKPAINQIQVVPIRVDRVVVAGPWQAVIGECGVHCRELGVPVR